MSDDPPLSARTPRPVAPGGQRKRPPGAPPRRPNPPPSQESRFIGYLVLGFGLLAMIAVGLIWLSGRHKTEPARIAATATPQTLINDMTASPQTAAPKPAVRQPVYARQPKIDIDDLQGNWQGTIGKYTAVLQIQNGVYQIIMAQPDPNAARLYSSGQYSTLEDIILLVPRLDWPPPVTPAGSVPASYEMITRAQFPVTVSFQNGKLVWQNPPQSEKRVLVPYRMPLLGDEKTDYIVWDKLK